MWEECDRNICSDRCKDRIMRAKDFSDSDACSKLVTGVKKDSDNNDVNILMTDDIKQVIIDRLRFCKQIADSNEGNFDSISYGNHLKYKTKSY